MFTELETSLAVMGTIVLCVFYAGYRLLGEAEDWFNTWQCEREWRKSSIKKENRDRFKGML